MTIEIPIVTSYKDKGAKAAEKGLDKLAGSAKKLGLALGLALSVNRMVAFGKASVAAFNAEEKSLTSLNQTLKNTGNLLALPEIENAIKKLSTFTGIADDELRPAYQKLYLASGDVAQAQKDLALAIDVSKGTSNDLGTVIDALSRGYFGNYKALSTLGAGLGKAVLDTKDMAKITAELAMLQGGQAARYAETYAGKVARIGVAIGEAKESFGKGIIDGTQMALGATSIEQVTKAIENMGYALQATTTRLGVFAKAASDSLVGKVLSMSISGWSEVLGINKEIALIKQRAVVADLNSQVAALAQAAAQEKLRKEFEKKLAADKKAQAAALSNAKKLAAEQAKLKKAGALMDLDQIQLVAALQGKITEDEKLRLQLQMALIQENGTEAERLADKLAQSQLLTTGLATAINNLPPALNPLKDYPSYVNKAIDDIQLIQDALNKLKAPVLTVQVNTNYTGAPSYVGGGTQGTATAPSTLGLAGLGLGGDQGAAAKALEYASMAKLNTQLPDYQSYRAGERASINVTVQGNVISNRDLTDSIRMGLLDSSASGSVSNSLRALGGG